MERHASRPHRRPIFARHSVHETALPRLVAGGVVLMEKEFCRLKGVSVTAAAGEVVGLVGRSGSGKTSVLAFLAGESAHFSGAHAVYGVLKVSGAVVRGAPAPALVGSDLVAPVPALAGSDLAAPVTDSQPTAAGWLTARAVAAGAHPRSALPWARERLDELELSAYADVVVVRLPPRERQLLRLAGASAGTPDVILLDEPMRGLSPAQRDVVRAFIRRQRVRNAAILVAVHPADLDKLDYDRLYVIEDGSIVARGTLHELRAAGAV